MRVLALATDYDGTLAEQGRVQPATLEALRRFRASGRKLILVTGRQAADLLRVFPLATGLFDAVVAENGGTLSLHGAETPLGPAPSPALLAALRREGVAPLDHGRVVIGTLRSQEEAVRRVIGPDMHVVFNGDALMVLPAGLDKLSGARAAAERLGLPLEGIVSVGDSENDLPLLAGCGCGVAVANALPELKAIAARVTRAPAGAGVIELLDALR